MPPRTQPVSGEAVLGLSLAIVAIGLAILGVYNPWDALRFPTEQKLSGITAILAYGTTCVLPIGLGVAGAGFGGLAFRAIERSKGKLGGDGAAFFSLMVGLFAAVIGSCTTFAAIVWPMM